MNLHFPTTGEILVALMVLAGICLAIGLGIGYVVPHCFTMPKEAIADASAQQIDEELDKLTGRLQRIIEGEQKRTGHYIVATPPPPVVYGALASETDIRIKLQYLLWQIEVIIAIRRIEDEKAGQIGLQQTR